MSGPCFRVSACKPPFYQGGERVFLKQLFGEGLRFTRSSGMGLGRVKTADSSYGKTGSVEHTNISGRPER
jgi:hypothetical protein